MHQARQWLLEAFAARFEDPPAAVRAAVAASGDLEQLSRWLRAVVRAADAQTAAAAVLGDHCTPVPAAPPPDTRPASPQALGQSVPGPRGE